MWGWSGFFPLVMILSFSSPHPFHLPPPFFFCLLSWFQIIFAWVCQCMVCARSEALSLLSTLCPFHGCWVYGCSLFPILLLLFWLLCIIIHVFLLELLLWLGHFFSWWWWFQWREGRGWHPGDGHGMYHPWHITIETLLLPFLDACLSAWYESKKKQIKEKRKRKEKYHQ